MNKKALLSGLIYAALVIVFKLYIWLGGHTFSDFYFKYAHILSVLAIIPFVMLSIKLVRDQDSEGIISGKEAMRSALTVVAVSAIVLSIYNYFEFKFSIQAYVDYYRSDKYMTFLLKDPKAKQLGYEKIIEFQISQLSPFKAATGKLFPFLLISLSASFISAVFMKKGPKI
jgi:hypothetical protein